MGKFKWILGVGVAEAAAVMVVGWVVSKMCVPVYRQAVSVKCGGVLV